MEGGCEGEHSRVVMGPCAVMVAVALATLPGGEQVRTGPAKEVKQPVTAIAACFGNALLARTRAVNEPDLAFLAEREQLCAARAGSMQDEEVGKCFVQLHAYPTPGVVAVEAGIRIIEAVFAAFKHRG